MNKDQRKKLKELYVKIAPEKDATSFQFQQIESFIDGLPNFIQEKITPFYTDVLDVKTKVKVLSDSINGMTKEFSDSITELKASGATGIEVSSIISEDMEKLAKTLKGVLLSSAKSQDEIIKIEKAIADIKKELEGLYWNRANGSNNVQAVLNIKSAGTTVANNVTGINFTNGTTVANPDGTVNYTAPSTPPPPNDATKFLNGQGVFTVPAGLFQGVLASAPSSPVDGWTYINSVNSGYYIYYAGAWNLLATLTPAVSSFYLMENGVDKYLLENGTDKYIIG